jgi:hypothetical protein
MKKIGSPAQMLDIELTSKVASSQKLATTLALPIV